MGIEAITVAATRRNLPQDTRSTPYLLRKLAVTRPNQVWAMDISYIPMARGFVYLCAVVDRFSRRVLSWRLLITMETAFCIEAVERHLPCGKPGIFSTDQGRSSPPWTAAAHGGTMSLSSGSGGRSNMRRSICTPTKACRKPELRSAGTPVFIIPDAHMHPLTGRHRIRLTSTR